MRRSILVWAAVVGVLLGVSLPLAAQDSDVPDAVIVNDEGGPVVIQGDVTYTNTLFTSGIDEPLIILEDQAGFVDRNRGFLMPPESQVLGQITTDFYTSPFRYTIALPIEPQASLRDVDHDDLEETGVMIYAVAYWFNVYGPPFLEERDLAGGGWSSAYASTRVDPDLSDGYEYLGGKLLIYAPDDAQSFPSGFGPDGRLFTEDDPIVNVPQGYTVVDMDTDPFTFDRSRVAEIDLIEGEAAETDDFSNLSFTAAFDAMIEKFRNEYAFTEYKGLDWDALSAEFRPMFEAAEARNDWVAYQYALQQFIWAIPDDHVSIPLTPDLQRIWIDETGGGLGMTIRETDDGQVIVNYLVAGGPASAEGIQRGAEILSINGRPVTEVIDEVQPWSGPFSTEHTKRLHQLRYAVRFPVGTNVEITYQNPGETQSTTATLTAIAESESLIVSQPNYFGLTGFELPLEYRLLDSGYAYVKIYSFIDAQRLTIDLWERLIDTLNQQGIPGLVIDLRQNGGGYGFTANQMAAYFFNEPHILGYNAIYDASTGNFEVDENRPERFYLPPEDQRYHGAIAVIVSPACASACESFAKALTVDNRATIVGHYPTGGLGGSIEDFFMPGPIAVRMTIGRGLDAEGNIDIEGIGVVPTVDVPVTVETLLSDEDVLLQAAVDVLSGPRATVLESGEIALEQVVSGVLETGTRQRFTFTPPRDMQIDLILEDRTGALDTVLRVYDEAGDIVAENDDAQPTQDLNSAIVGLNAQAGVPLVIEVAAYADVGSGKFVLTVSESE